MRNIKTKLVAGVSLLLPMAVFADDTTVTSLTTSATTMVTGLVAAAGTIFLAAIAIPVAKKGYAVIRGFLNKA